MPPQYGADAAAENAAPACRWATRTFRAMDYASCRSLPAMFFATARQRAGRPFLWAKRDGKYQSLSWGEAESAVTRLARALIGCGIQAGDGVGLVWERRPEWLSADLAMDS